MKYELFSRLYSEALEYEDVDMYIAERAWQDWMEKCKDEYSSIAKMLMDIYEIAHMDIREIREKIGLSRAKFSKIFLVPDRTLQDWEYGKSKMSVSLKMLISYAVFLELNGRE